MSPTIMSPTIRIAALLLASYAGLALAQDFPAAPLLPSPAPLPIIDPANPADPAGTAGVLRVPGSTSEWVDLVQPLPILDRLVVPGTKQQLEWRPKGAVSNTEMPSPVVVQHGAKPGPVLCLVAGIHGDEINGVEIVRRISHGIDPTRLSGTVIGVPIVNVFGYSRGVRYLPDRRDLNRNFPGSPRGSIAARIGHGFFTDIIQHCDYLIDFHTGSFDRENLPQIRADLTDGAVLEFTRAFGATLVLHSPGSKGMLRTAAIASGVPSVTFEVGAPARLQLAEIASATSTIEGVLRKLGMRKSRQSEVGVAPPPTYFDARWVRANAGGLLVSEVALGQRVQAGQPLGRIIDPVANVETEVLSPWPGRVIGMAQNQQVLPGFAAFHLGKETSEQQAVEHAEIGPDDAGVQEGEPPRSEGDPEDGDG